MKSVYRTLIIASATMLGLCAHADTWQYFAYNMQIDDFDRDKEFDYEFQGVIVYYPGQGQSNFMLDCSSHRGLRVAFGLNDTDFHSTFGKQTGKVRVTVFNMEIGEQAYRSMKAVYLPTFKVTEALEQAPARRVYNAIVKNQRITAQVSGKGKKTYTPPPVDSAFKTFVKNCPVTNPDGQ